MTSSAEESTVSTTFSFAEGVLGAAGGGGGGDEKEENTEEGSSTVGGGGGGACAGSGALSGMSGFFAVSFTSCFVGTIASSTSFGSTMGS